MSMRRFSDASSISILAVALVAWACGDVPTQSSVDAEPLQAKGGVPGPPGGGGGGGGGDDDDGGDDDGGGGSDPSVALSFVDPAGPADVAIRMFSDGAGDYTENISVGRQLVFDPDEKNGTRTLCLRFTEDQETSGAGIHPDLADDLDATGMVCSAGDFRTVWHDNDDLGLEAMALDEAIRAEARYIWEDGQNNQFKLEFFCADDRGSDGGTSCANLLDVTLVSDADGSRTWSVSFDAALEAVVSRNFVKGKPNPFLPIGSFHVPFEATVTLTE